MNRDERRWAALGYARSFIGIPYMWGGDDPMAGFDCSGFVIEVLKSVGLLKRQGDWTAGGLHHFFNDPEQNNCDAGPGCLVFWHSRSDSSRIIHVELCMNDYQAVGASGGGGDTVTVKDAVRRNAYVKVRPIFSRRRIHSILDPFRNDPLYIEPRS